MTSRLSSMNLDLSNLPALKSVTFRPSYGPGFPAEVDYLLDGDDPAAIDPWAQALSGEIERHETTELSMGIRLEGASFEVDTMDGLRICVSHWWTVKPAPLTVTEVAR